MEKKNMLQMRLRIIPSTNNKRQFLHLINITIYERRMKLNMIDITFDLITLRKLFQTIYF